MNISDNLLFSQFNIFSVLRGELDNVQQEVDSISREHFQANSNEQVTNYIFSKIEITPLKIYKDRMVLTEPREVRVAKINMLGESYQAASVHIEVSVPYIGESDLWKMQPSSYTLNPPRGNPIPNRGNDQIGVLEIELEYTQDEFQSDTVNQEIENILAYIENYLQSIEHDIGAHNLNLKEKIHRLVQQRRKRLGAIEDVTKNLNVPIKKREGTPNITELPVQRKILQPLSTKKDSKPEYAISDSNYDLVLNVIRQEGASFERAPATFAVHNEEGLRDILLAHLNSYFQGQATGETFRKKGKTDILIEFENRAAFVSECKLWRGDKKFIEAVDQLLGYLTWRDVKAALIIFDKDVASFKNIQEKIPNILRSHPKFQSVEPVKGGTEWKVLFLSDEDTDRIINVHVFLFNLFVAGG